jgi:transcriptional regulator with XRE-family HTH domain
MITKGNPRHFIRQWRQKRRLSLRKLADRLLNPDGTAIISYASLGRIEQGVQPYSQEALEAIADALQTDVGSLLTRDPSDDEAIHTIWQRIPTAQRNAALAMLKGLAETGFLVEFPISPPPSPPPLHRSAAKKKRA